MLQVSLGGYLNSENTDPTVFTPVYYEPGFLSTMEPLVFSVPESDQIYILIRKRSDSTGDNFTQLVPSDFEPYSPSSITGDESSYNLRVIDTTNNQPVPAYVQVNPYLNWNDREDYSPLVLVITHCFNLVTPSARVRSIDCFIRYPDDGSFIRFRITTSDSSRLFSYLIIDSNNLQDRPTFSASSRESIIKIGGNTDNYLLFSPYAFLKEVDNGQGDFSYPLESIYYQRQESYNDEGFVFSIDDSYITTKPWIYDNISVFNVPGYDKACVVLIDKNIYRYLTLMRDEVFISIKVVGKSSENIDNFKVYLVA